jgi:hypothetical protein
MIEGATVATWRAMNGILLPTIEVVRQEDDSDSEHECSRQGTSYLGAEMVCTYTGTQTSLYMWFYDVTGGYQLDKA